MVTILHEQIEADVSPLPRSGDGLWLSPADLMRATGFELKPEGLCRDAICVPVPKGRHAFATDDAIDVVGFWHHLGHPIAHDETRTVWALGPGAGARRQALESLEAPDFTLPDLDGRPHALSDYRGRKVFLVSWASW
jgi:hypothetical protein